VIKPASSQAAAPTRRTSLLPPLGIALLALLLSLFFHSPRLWVLAQPLPGSTYWDRGLQFMQQVENPLGARLVDAGLVWRLAPALLAQGLGLHGRASLVVPWIGLLLLLTLCAGLVLRRTGDRSIAFLLTALLGTTSAVLTVTGWLGFNDAWYAGALLAVAFLPGNTVLTTAVLVGPWIDERFILALPLALWVRSAALGEAWRPRFALPVATGGIMLYACSRILNLPHLPTATTGEYLSGVLAGNSLQWLPWVSLGWFMGLRAAWFLIAVAIGGTCRSTDLRPAVVWPATLALGPLLVITLLAADTGRAPTMLLPLLLLGTERLVTLHGVEAARRLLGWLLIANLLMPAMHVTYKSGDIINMFPVEIARLLWP